MVAKNGNITTHRIYESITRALWLASIYNCSIHDRLSVGAVRRTDVRRKLDLRREANPRILPWRCNVSNVSVH